MQSLCGTIFRKVIHRKRTATSALQNVIWFQSQFRCGRFLGKKKWWSIMKSISTFYVIREERVCWTDFEPNNLFEFFKVLYGKDENFFLVYITLLLPSHSNKTRVDSIFIIDTERSIELRNSADDMKGSGGSRTALILNPSIFQKLRARAAIFRWLHFNIKFL